MIEFVKNYFSKFRKYVFTFSVIYLVTILFTFSYGTDLTGNNVFLSFLIYLVFLSLFFLIVESKFKNKKKDKYLLLSLIPSSIIGIVSYFVFSNNFSLTFDIYFLFFLLFIFIISCLYFIYNVYKSSKKSFEEYFKNVLFNIIETLFVYLVLVIGISLLLALFLILIGYFENLIIKFQQLLIGLYLIPSLILSFEKKENKSIFLSSIFVRLLLILMLIAFLIIYIYMFKLIFTNTLLDNSIFYILSFLFVLSLPVWTVNSVLEPNNKINKYIPYAFIPFIILQIIAIAIRIYDYGITEIRYLGIMFILIEIIYMVMYIFKIKLENIIFAVAAISFVTLICPFLNIVSVSNYSQFNRLLKIYEKDDISKKELHEIALKYERFSSGYCREFIEKKLEKDVIVDLENIYRKNRYNYDSSDYEINRYKHHYWSNDKFTSFNVSEFKKVIIINYYEEKVDLRNVDILNYKVNLSKVVNNMIKDTKYLDNHYTIDFDDDNKLIITHINFEYDEIDDKVSELSIKGYLLTK